MKDIFTKKVFMRIRTGLLIITLLAIGSPQYISASVHKTEQTQKEVTGKVFDSSTKETLPGVSVSVKGTNIATMTDADGNFSIKVPYAEATLVFSYIGFQPQQIELKGKTTLNVDRSSSFYINYARLL